MSFAVLPATNAGKVIHNQCEQRLELCMSEENDILLSCLDCSRDENDLPEILNYRFFREES